MTIAANGRSHIVIRGVLAAAQRARAAVIIEIAKSEGGREAYCPVSYWNIARQVDAIANELEITVPVAIHADHYGIKNDADLEQAREEIPSMFEAGITSIAIDASHQPDDRNLLANIAMKPYIPEWAGLETEIGEIKGKDGLSSPAEAVFLIAGLNAYGIFPDWIALNNGTTHGIEASGQGIDVDLTLAIHQAIAKYKVSGAQHGTSGNSFERLRQIAQKTHTTKANVATALQMLSWGLSVNEEGNARQDADGDFIKIEGEGMTEALWQDMLAYARSKGISGGNYKKLNLPFENKILSQPEAVRRRMAKRVEDFTYTLLVDVFNAKGTADLVIADILKNRSYHPGVKAEIMESKDEWTEDAIVRKAAGLNSDKGPAGDFDD
jgi:fructose/tagatose bisphosphate aldolase